MKNTLPLLLLLFTASLFAQNYHPLLVNGREWKSVAAAPFGAYLLYETFATGNDTLIASVNYKTIHKLDSVYREEVLMREDTTTQKVYLLLNGTEQLIYDFSLNLNDSVYLQWNESFFNGYYKADSISTVNTLAGPRKFMRLSKTQYYVYWLEGVGALNGRLNYTYDYCAPFIDCAYNYNTYCQTEGGLQTFERSPRYSCSSGELYDCSMNISSNHVDADYVFSAQINSIGPYTYKWLVYNIDSTTAVVIDSSAYPSPHFTLPLQHHYSLFLYTGDTAMCSSHTGIAVYDTIAPLTPACQALFWVYPDTTAGSYFAGNLSSGNNLSYLWNFGDGTTSTLPYPSHQYATPARYTICLTINNGAGCVSTYCDSSFYNYKTGGGPMSAFNVMQFTGIPPISETGDITLYPNPATNQLYLSVAAARLRLYNTTGQLMLDLKQPGNRPIDISQLSPGLYIAEISQACNGCNYPTAVKRRVIKL